ncbi:MAG TPA: molybdopterin-dependent oxidoreductase, partial [Chthonomonadales bacterium]|nr:molybdopterin-dependent oxidoreductase [Chthonomonadales bacterium]
LTALDSPPIRSLFVFNSNPAAVAPNSNLVLKGLARTDLFTIVHEQMISDTARYADILLPATTQMEHLDLMRAYGHLYLNLCLPAIEPLGEARPNIDVQNRLAKAMGYTDGLFNDSAEDIIRAALCTNDARLDGITFEHLAEHGFAKLKLPSEPFVPFVDGRGFNTPSGKIELYSARAERDGYDPLPGYQPAEESAEGNPEQSARFPINLLSPAGHHFLNSTFANLESLQKAEREPRIWIDAADAAERGLEDGDLARVWNERGDVHLTVVVSDKVKRGVAWSPSLWWHRDSPMNRNVNALTSDRLTDMGGGSTFHTNLVQIERAEA